MLSELKEALDVLVRIVPGVLNRFVDRRRRQLLLELQEAFFILGGLIETGEELLVIAGDKPTLKIDYLTRQQMKEHYTFCQSRLSLQTYRMQRLGKIFLSTPFLDFLDPPLRAELKRVIGDKENGLYNVGAALFFHQMFGSARFQDEPEEEAERRITQKQAEFIESLYGVFQDKEVDLTMQRQIIAKLKDLHLRLSRVINDMCSVEEKVILSSKAAELARRYDYSALTDQPFD